MSIRFQFPDVEAAEMYQTLSKQTHKSGSAVDRFVSMLGRAIRFVGQFSDDEDSEDSEDALVDKGVELAKLNGRIRELQESNQAVLQEKRELWQELKVIAEDRDDYQRNASHWKSEFLRIEELRHAIRPPDQSLTTPDLGVCQTGEQLFLIWKDGGSVPHPVHTGSESAIKEAQRLARANPGDRFYVLYAICNASMLAPNVQTVITDERFDDRAEIPF